MKRFLFPLVSFLFCLLISSPSLARRTKYEIEISKNFFLTQNAIAVSLSTTSTLGGLPVADIYQLLKEQGFVDKIDQATFESFKSTLRRFGYLMEGEDLDYKKYEEIYGRISAIDCGRKLKVDMYSQISQGKHPVNAFLQFINFLNKENFWDKDKIEEKPTFLISRKFNPNEEYRLVVLIDGRHNQKLYADRRLWKTDTGENIGIRDFRKKKLKTMNEFVKEFQQKNPEQEVVAVVPNGNLLWNDWFVAWINGEIYSRKGEPVDKREYSMLVVKKNGEVVIENLRFKKEEGKYRVIDEEGKDITSEVLYATFGQKIVENGKPVNIVKKGNFVQWDDLRHLLSFPRLKWDKIFNILGVGEELGQRENLSRSLYVGLRTLLGEEVDVPNLENLVKTRQLLAKALEGEPVEINFIEELKKILDERLVGIVDEQQKKAIIAEVDKKKTELISLLANEGFKGYREDEDGDVERGEYSLNKEDGTFTIGFKPGVYPHVLIGVTKEGEIIVTVVEGISGRMGVTLKEAQDLMIAQGAKDAIMVCNGGDAVFGYNDKILLSSGENRSNFTSVILVVRPKTN